MIKIAQLASKFGSEEKGTLLTQADLGTLGWVAAPGGSGGGGSGGPIVTGAGITGAGTRASPLSFDPLTATVNWRP